SCRATFCGAVGASGVHWSSGSHTEWPRAGSGQRGRLLLLLYQQHADRSVCSLPTERQETRGAPRC
ncbi:hypothetical protein KUCAC02_002317, partial [Chaenocephalus aceratus]